MSENIVLINNEYHWGTYCNFKVMIMTKNNYINATKICNDESKRLKDWLKNQASKEQISTLSKEENISEEFILIKNMKGANETRGTYVHPDLMFSIVSWISAKNALMMNKILRIALSSDPNELEIEKLSKLLSTIKIKKDENNQKYIKVKRNTEQNETEKYTLDEIIIIVNPIIVLKDLEGKLSDIRKTLRSSINKRCGIYMFFNKETNEFYIGSSKSIISRVSNYLTDSYIEKPSKYRNLIKDAMIKHTKAAFSLLILETMDNYNQVFEREMYYIDLLKPRYNIDLYKLIKD